MKIRIEIDVPDNSSGTKCKECPFGTDDNLCMWAGKRCDKVDFTKMKVKEYESKS